jgi:hypothetical protein
MIFIPKTGRRLFLLIYLSVHESFGPFMGRPKSVLNDCGHSDGFLLQTPQVKYFVLLFREPHPNEF